VLTAAQQSGQSAALVIRGDPGIGKTSLLEYAAGWAEREGWRDVRAFGVESEMELSFAGLHQLCEPLLDGPERLPTPQQAALETAFGMASGPPPDRFLLGLAVLSLLSDSAENSPLICLVDDAQWLDRSSAQVLGFVARRLEKESVVFLLAEREPMQLNEFARLPELQLQGLTPDQARDLLASVITTPLDEGIREQMLAETHGNPLALIELARELSLVERAGGFGLPETPVPLRIETEFRNRVQQLPVDSQRLLLVAAAEPTGAPALLSRAALQLGIPLAAAAPVVKAGMLDIGVVVTFSHPLLRSAIYHAATADERRAVHAALSAATDARLDPDRRAWHRAQATLFGDEGVAAELERSADRAQGRGGFAAAAAFLERAVALTPDRGRRAKRALSAANAKQLAGAREMALSLLETAAAGPLDSVDQAMVQRLRGQISLDLRRGGDAVLQLLDAARRLAPLDPDLARETFGEALRAANIAGRLGEGVREAAAAARDAPPSSGAPRAVDLLLDGLTVRFTDGYVASAPSLKRALSELLADADPVGEDARWPWFGRRVAPDLFDDDAWEALATRDVQMARDRGALAVLPLALNYLAQLRIFEGEFDDAAALIEEADAITDSTGNDRMAVARGLLAACRGDEAHAISVIEAEERTARARGEGVVLTFSEHARALLYNALGQYEAALGPAKSASDQDEPGVSVWSLPELVESAARCGRVKIATEALERVIDRVDAAGTGFALGIGARCRALVNHAGTTEELYLEAVDRLGRSRVTLEHARARLLYGEWLRRQGRRADAREQLRAAYEQFCSMGAEAFAKRARRELAAAGERARRRESGTRGLLTVRESQIARLARDGFSNSEIGTQLFISPRTVEYHLHKVFEKLAIRSRTQLASVLSGEARPASLL
jgi:DNA-binding CsgD family transcriptional regulator/tetratricopeptide (TPR) repeat protein